MKRVVGALGDGKDEISRQELAPGEHAVQSLLFHTCVRGESFSPRARSRFELINLVIGVRPAH